MKKKFIVIILILVISITGCKNVVSKDSEYQKQLNNQDDKIQNNDVIIEETPDDNNIENNNSTKKSVKVKRIWMDNPGVKVSVGEKITVYVEAEFKNKPDSIVLWFASKSNPNSIKSAGITPLPNNNNIYEVTLTIDDRMQPGEWEGTWYYISDYYGEYIQQDYENIVFTIN